MSDVVDGQHFTVAPFGLCGVDDGIAFFVHCRHMGTGTVTSRGTATLKHKEESGRVQSETTPLSDAARRPLRIGFQRQSTEQTERQERVGDPSVPESSEEPSLGVAAEGSGASIQPNRRQWQGGTRG